MTYSELLASEEVRKDYPALVEALASLGDAQVRNRATIGGSLAYNDPTADLPAVALVLEAVIKTVGPNGERARPAEEFLIGALKTTLESGEIVTAIHFVSDFHASAEYRTHLTRVLAERALTRAAERAGYAL